MNYAAILCCAVTERVGRVLHSVRSRSLLTHTAASDMKPADRALQVSAATDYLLKMVS